MSWSEHAAGAGDRRGGVVLGGRPGAGARAAAGAAARLAVDEVGHIVLAVSGQLDNAAGSPSSC